MAGVGAFPGIDELLNNQMALQLAAAGAAPSTPLIYRPASSGVMQVGMGGPGMPGMFSPGAMHMPPSMAGFAGPGMPSLPPGAFLTQGPSGPVVMVPQTAAAGTAVLQAVPTPETSAAMAAHFAATMAAAATTATAAVGTPLLFSDAKTNLATSAGVLALGPAQPFLNGTAPAPVPAVVPAVPDMNGGALASTHRSREALLSTLAAAGTRPAGSVMTGAGAGAGAGARAGSGAAATALRALGVPTDSAPGQPPFETVSSGDTASDLSIGASSYRSDDGAVADAAQALVRSRHETETAPGSDGSDRAKRTRVM